MSQELTDSLTKDNNQCTQNNESTKECNPSGPTTTDTDTKKLSPPSSEVKEEERKNTEDNNIMIEKIKKSIENMFSVRPKKEEMKKEDEKKEEDVKKDKEKKEEVVKKEDVKKEEEKKEDEKKQDEKKEDVKKEDMKKEEENSPKNEENKNIINLPKNEEEKHPKKEQNKFDYVFPIPSGSSKMEESKNSDPSYFLYKIPQNNFSSLNLKIPDNLRPKNKELQNQNRLNFNLSYFSPITISCSINAHSVKRSKLRQKEKEQEFFEKIIKISDVSNIQEFWEVFQHLLKPNQCPVGSDYHIFKKGIVPMWEDKLNKDGGKLSVLLTWKYANVIWEEVTFNFAKGLLPYYDYINGIVISTRPKFLVLSFWIKCGNNAMVEKIRNALSGFLQAPSSNCFDYIPFH